MVTWDIITGSKGGVGKTLFSLMLLARYLNANQTMLVVDLNSMNTDFARMLVRTKIIGSSSVDILGSSFNVYYLRFLIGGVTRHCIVMSPENPFRVLTPEIFADTLVAIKNALVRIRSFHKMEKLPEVNHIIVDTNYHFCNIFHQSNFNESNTNGNYATYREGGALHNDQFYIWFLWVAAQLEALLPHIAQNDGELLAVTSTATSIEHHVPNLNNTPFIHVFNPYVLYDAVTTEENIVAATIRIFRNSVNPDLTIPEYTALINRAIGPIIRFDDWLDILTAIWNDIPNGNQLDGRVRFGQTIINSIGNVRNANIFPLATIHKTLTGYTDRTVPVGFDRLIASQLYNEFNILMGNYGR